ncbi:hypothetical protein Celaphus_00009591 [Cervus elaphus hippelaphus]|uniref:MAGE domain-containing protein n=1 Tax=Cervus elaphus hippelaphus TaxID=46360 RepID=A0A212C0E3_CEREH|nr:hypothetical protein Celaphus_00009591 [Cervus elaphus hippelaphus]
MLVVKMTELSKLKEDLQDPVSCSTLVEALPLEALKEMYLAKHLTSKEEMLKKVLRGNQEHIVVVFSQASECLQVVIGLKVKEMYPGEHICIMVPTLGLTCDVMLSSGQSLHKAGLLVLVLSLNMQSEDLVPRKHLGSTQQDGGVCWE